MNNPIYKKSASGAQLFNLNQIDDERGNLCVVEAGNPIPFEIKRTFFIYDVPSASLRGEHAHKECHQFLICQKGSIYVSADNGRVKEEFILDKPNKGIYLPPMTWGGQYNYTSDAVLLVLASHLYDEADYIRNYSDFIAAINSRD